MMTAFLRSFCLLSLLLVVVSMPLHSEAQTFPTRYPTLELFTNTPCPICGSQNPGLFNRLQNYEGQYHLISFYPGKPYSSCIFYQANIAENTTRYNHYTGEIFGSPTVAINGLDFKSSSGVTTTILNNITGGTSWLHVGVDETDGAERNVTITLEDIAGGSVSSGRLFAVIVEREIMYNAPNGETLHHNVFRRFLTAPAGEEVDMSSGQAVKEYTYNVDGTWNAAEVYVIAWLSNPDTKEIYNSGSRFDPDFTSSVDHVESLATGALFPNPADSYVNLELPSGISSAVIEVYNQQGRLVRADRVQDQTEFTISTDRFSPGVYLVRVIHDKKVYSGSFEVVR